MGTMESVKNWIQLRNLHKIKASGFQGVSFENVSASL